MQRLIFALFAGVAGIALMLTGLGIDVYLHGQDETLAAREGIFTLSNPGHLFLAIGMALICGSTFAAIYIAWGMSECDGLLGQRWVRVISMQAVGLLSVSAVGFALAASGEGPDHGHGVSAEAAATQVHANHRGAEAWTQAAPRTAADADPRTGSSEVAESQTVHTHVEESVAGATQAGMPEMLHSHESMESTEPLMDDMSNDSMTTVNPTPHEHAVEDTDFGAGNTHPMNHPQPGAEELACLSGLTAQAKELTARLVSYDAAVAEGYRLPARVGGTHHPNPAYQRDGSVFDLARPESAIYRTTADGSRVLIGVLYHAPVGGGPTPCGNATWWHTHPTCVEPSTRARLDAGPDGLCPEGTLFRSGRTEMLHLWFVPRRGLN